MFKLESYITPILLSYVNKYINNFKLEDSQVSLWGGDATFNNLELNLQVLEQELQLPFSFLSGSIRELLIHVPWTKLASEPITITINTIECILNLKGKDPTSRNGNSQPKEKIKRINSKEDEPLQGYLQQLINKIVSNIKINCSNVILKYVEEDIVLSMNIKLLTFESANNKWEPAYTDVSQAEVTLRKVIKVHDLTLCLDKRNASGKIEVYQEPMLYRCSMTMHFLRQYFSATARKASTTRLDIYCNNMEFSMTEQQVPMFMRLLLLLYSLQQKQLKPEKNASAEGTSTSQDPNDISDNNESWTGWAWSYVSSVLPATWDDEHEEQAQLQKGHTLHFGFYVDNASITFKLSETSSERNSGYYSHKKLRYNPMLTLQLQGIYSESILHGLKWFNAQGGISRALLLPVGFCSCSHMEVIDEYEDINYLKMGSETSSHKSDSLFDAEAVENQGQRRQYNTSWDYHMIVYSESVLLERTPAFAYDYLYQMELPCDSSSDILSDLGSDNEFSNLSETSSLRVCVGPFKLRLCSGFFHRLSTLSVAASYYDYPPYYTPKQDLTLQELLPPSSEDFDALNEFIPSRSVRLTIFAPVIELELMDHPYFQPVKGSLFKKRKKLSMQGSQAQSLPFDLPRLTIECQFVDVTLHYPMYINRLVHTTCQLPEPPKNLFDACYSQLAIKVMSLCSRLILNAQSHTTILSPSSMSYSSKTISKPQYWINPDIAHEEAVFESESVSLNGTNAKMMVVAYIITKLMKMDSEGSVKTMANTSILSDASKENDLPYMELCIEGIRFKKVATNATVSIDASLGSVKAFIFEPIELTVVTDKNGKYTSTAYKDLQQVLFLSGPDPKPMAAKSDDIEDLDELPLFVVTIQYPISPEIQNHAPILLFNMQEIRICIDPLLCRWLLYTPKPLIMRHDSYESQLYKTMSASEVSSSNVIGTPRKLSTQIESVHSNSDREQLHLPKKLETVMEENPIDLQERIYNILKKWFDVWKGMFLYGDVSQCTIYFPLVSLSAVGSQGIQEAVESMVNKENPPDIMVITLPFANIRSAHRQSIKKYLKVLPVALPDTIWTNGKSSFPWTMSISDLSCYTIQFGNKLTFLKPVSLSATVGLSTRPSKDNVTDSKNDIGSLGVCVHIDMTPIEISTSEVQIYLFASVLYGLMEVASNLLPNQPSTVPKVQEVFPPTLTKGSSTLSPTLLKENTFDSTSETSPSNQLEAAEADSVKLTAWVQWTVTRFTMELLSNEQKGSNEEEMESLQPRLKLVVDAEDIVSSLDFQSVYLKIKSKIGSVSIHHYKRTTSSSKWKPGPFSGIVMKLREDVSSSQHHEENSFFSVTITRASCRHTHTLWGALQKRQKEAKKADLINQQFFSQNRYITEIVVNIQPIDFVVSLKTLRSFYLVVKPLLEIPVRNEQQVTISNNLSVFNNQTLPLAYLECQDIRIIFPSVELKGSSTLHDIVIFQVQKICLNPNAVNPICRTPMRPDVYEQAAHARILNIPGSEIEDRQYQLDLISISVCTGLWKDLDLILTSTNKMSSLRGKSENPAVEWNNLEQGQPNLLPAMNFWPITDKFDITLIAAPAMVYKESVVICGHSVEVNFVSDIFVHLSLNQIKLHSALLSEFLLLVEPLAREDDPNTSQIRFPYSRLERSSVELENSSLEILRDSGIETSDIKSIKSSKMLKSHSESSKLVLQRQQSATPVNLNLIPFEVLFAAGKIGCGLYQVDETKVVLSRFKNKKKKLLKKAEDDQGYEAEEENVDVNDSYKKYIPLIYIGLKQPNAFISRQQFGRKIQVSCFDLSLKLSGPEYLPVEQVPTEEDYAVSLLETKSGIPDSSTGILPAFFTLRYSKNISKSTSLEIEISKPTKILCSMSKWAYLLVIKDKAYETFKGAQKNSVLYSKCSVMSSQISKTSSMNYSIAKPTGTYSKFHQLKSLLKGINSVSLKCNQLIFSIKSDAGHEVNLAIGKLKSHLSLSSRPERLNLSCSLNCITLTIIKENFKKLLLNPWTVSLDISLFWESWQTSESEPLIQLTITSDCIMIDISPEQINSVEIVMKEVREFISALPFNRESGTEIIDGQKTFEKDQHYKDDLRAGAFQFVDANSENTDEIPLPYQVIFYNGHISAMVWRYPQPRALTKVRIFPVPYKTTLGSNDDLQILCHLEYWSEVRNSYLPFTEFYLSESEVCHLTLPEGVVASTWRVLITTTDGNEDGNTPISPRALAACMRIDSYFNRSLIPNVTAAFYLSKIDVALYNYFDKNNPSKLPEYLEDYTPDALYPDNQKFLVMSLDNLTAFFAGWKFDVISGEITSALKVNVLDYTFLTDHAIVEPFTAKLEFDVKQDVNFSLISKPIEIKFGPSIAHSLAVASQTWHQSYLSKDSEKDFVMMTRYVICNNSNTNIRIGQAETEESILLSSRNFHLYSWYSQKKKQQLRVALEENNWIWSKSFSIDDDKTQAIQFNSEKNIAIFVSVKALSASQRKITISGQFSVSNMLTEHFEMKLIEAVSENKEAEFRNASTHIVTAKRNNPSIFINSKKKYFLRLRFYGLESAWTGDIPLKEHSNGSQPWLVKVPLQERGQFLSIWCRIVTQEFQKVERVLAMLWPLFMVKSNLPFNTKVHIETPLLNVHLDSVVNSKGELQQLYCPGTIDHSHQLTFKIDKSDTSSNPYVPLNYSLIDQHSFFKKPDKEDIDEILEVLKNFDKCKWPYLDEDLKDIEWIVDQRPLTHVQVRYQNACRHSSSLLVELLPWNLTVNTFGVPVTLMMSGVELCRIQHNGIIAPPKLEENFNIGICSGGTWNYSGPLQLSKSDWSQTFYMPKITGNIPLDGTIKTSIKFDSHISMLSITSSVSNEIRLLKIASTHVLSSHIPAQIQVVCIAVPEGKSVWEFPKNIDMFAFTLPPHLQKSNIGISIIQWYTLSQQENISDYALYLSFSIQPSIGWSCPIRVDKPFVRRSFNVLTKHYPLPLVLTAQEHKGQTFLAVHYDNRPQMVLENRTSADLFCAQVSPDGVIREAQHFRWYCKIPESGSVFYSIPILNEKFPELPQTSFVEKIAFACDSEKKLDDLTWSPAINLVNNNNEQFIRVPYYGDVKVIVVNMACTTFISLESVSEVEISARDIRVRLTMQDLPGMMIKERHSEPAPRVLKLYSVEDVAATQSDPNLSEGKKERLNEEETSMRCFSDTNLGGVSSTTRSLVISTLSLNKKWKSINCKVFLKAVSLVFLSDLEKDGQERWEVASLVCDDVSFSLFQEESMRIKVTISEMQFDNQLYCTESYDFPVALIGQDKKERRKLIALNVPIESLMKSSEENPIVRVECVLESWKDYSKTLRMTGVKCMKISVNPISCYLEDTYITRLREYFSILLPNNLIAWPVHHIPPKLNVVSGCVVVPEVISWSCAILAAPLTMRSLTIMPLSLLLSIHSSIRLYIALDQSPLHFGRFERRRVFTTPYRFGHALTMHYLSGAIFGAGWVVSSLELLGSPGVLARAMGTGLRDFVSLPYRGLVAGPMAFLKGVTQGSASLMKHVTAGTLQSVTKLASSVARNLDRLTLDEEHLRRTEEQRRQRPQGLAQGFIQGLTGLGISLLGAVGGIAHHPLQSVMTEGASPRSLVAGVGLGIVGMVTKPLSGAAELVALTGQGLLQGAGWNSFPEPRSLPTVLKIFQSVNSTLKYNWKYAHSITTSQFLYVIEATSINNNFQYEAIALILTVDALIVINMDEDLTLRIISLSDLNVVHNNDPTILIFRLIPPTLLVKSEEEMDPVSRARVADYVKSTVGLLNLPDNSPDHSEISVSPLSTPDIEEKSQESTVLTYYVNPQSKDYFLCVLSLAKQQHQNFNFPVL